MIEATAFVSPKWVPQMADTAEVMAGIQRRPGVSYPVLVPNMTGFEAASAAGVREIAVFGVDGQFYATDNICTHGHARLCDGFLLGEEIECPLHQGTFNVKTGAAVGAPCTVAVRTYPVKLQDGVLHVGMEG